MRIPHTRTHTPDPSTSAHKQSSVCSPASSSSSTFLSHPRAQGQPPPLSKHQSRTHTQTHRAPAQSPLRAAPPCAHTSPCSRTPTITRSSTASLLSALHHRSPTPPCPPQPPSPKLPPDSLSLADTLAHSSVLSLILGCLVLPHFPEPPLPGEASPPPLIAPGLSFLDSEAVHLVQSCPTQDPVLWAPWPGLWGFGASLGALGTWSSWCVSQEL